MIGCLRSCAGRLAALAVLGVAAGAAWLYWPVLSPRLSGFAGPEEPAAVVASPELADATLDRFERFRAGAEGDRIALGSAELSSVVRYALPGILPPGVSEPTVELVDGRLVLSAHVATAAFPDLPALDPVIGMLPDTVSVRMDGELAPFGRRSLAFHVDAIEASRIPLPARLVPEVLAGLGRTHRDGLPPDALHVPLPAGLESVFVLRDSLVLVSEP